MEADGQKSDLSVLHIGAGRYSPGDVEHSTFGIWRALAERVQRYTVVGRSKTGPAARFSSAGVDVRLIPSWTDREVEFLFSQFRANRIAREVNPNVIIAQCPVLGGLVGCQIAQRLGAKLLIEFHSSNYFEIHPRLSRYGIIEALTRRTLPHARRIRVLSEGMRKKLVERYGEGFAARTVVLPPRVDLSRFSAVKTDYRISARPKIVVVGSVNSRKNQLGLLRAVLPSSLDAEIWIVGAGPDIPACRAAAAEAGAADRVSFFGQVNHTELADILPRADAFVLFSTHEGTPRAILEAMAVGLPIVTTNAGFCADIVEDGVEGVILRRNPHEEIVPRLEELFANQALRERLGAAARQRAAAEFNSVDLFDRYRALIVETAQG